MNKRHRESLAHREMTAGFTTAAVINYGMCRPEEPVSALDYMPNHVSHAPAKTEMTDEELAKESSFWEAVRRETHRQKREMEERNGN